MEEAAISSPTGLNQQRRVPVIDLDSLEKLVGDDDDGRRTRSPGGVVVSGHVRSNSGGSNHRLKRLDRRIRVPATFQGCQASFGAASDGQRVAVCQLKKDQRWKELDVCSFAMG